MTHQQASSCQADVPDIAAIVSLMPGAAGFIDSGLRLREANAQLLAMLEAAPGEPLGQTIEQLLGEVTGQAIHAAVAQAKNPTPIEVEAWHGSGPQSRYIRHTLRPVTDLAGAMLGCLLVSTDLTGLKRRSEQLEQQQRIGDGGEALHRTIVETSLDCIIIVDGKGRVVDFNPAAERLFGYRREETLGREIGSLIIPPQYRAAHDAGMHRYVETGLSRVIGKRVELEALGKHGELIPVELSLADVSSGEQRFFTAHIRDLTDARKAQFEIERQRDALYQKEKLAALGSLLSGVAHELNNPLSIVLGQSMMLHAQAVRAGSSFPNAADLAERAQRIENAANRCARIVRTFLAMARQRKAERSYVSIARIAADAVDLLSYSLKTSGVTLQSEIAVDLPETFADADLLHQVLVNLIVNARQALEEKDGDRHIILRAAHDAATDAIVITVRDNGGGIPPAIRTRIFDPFFTTKPQDHGTGIGLAVSRGLIESHAGSLELALPQPDEGAEFVIRLPVTSHDQPLAPESLEPAMVPAQRNAPTVLIVDDEPDLADLIADMVHAMGYRAMTAASGHQAQRLFDGRNQHVDAILCDIRMPDGDGPGLYDWLAAHRPDLTRRIGFVTGDTLGPSAGRFLARTGCPVIEKPFTPADIAAVLSSLIAQGSEAEATPGNN
jgi:two-component system NtrC family sensor kinase